jgi:hypothetical protein
VIKIHSFRLQIILQLKFSTHCIRSPIYCYKLFLTNQNPVSSHSTSLLFFVHFKTDPAIVFENQNETQSSLYHFNPAPNTQPVGNRISSTPLYQIHRLAPPIYLIPKTSAFSKNHGQHMFLRVLSKEQHDDMDRLDSPPSKELIL